MFPFSKKTLVPILFLTGALLALAVTRLTYTGPNRPVSSCPADPVVVWSSRTNRNNNSCNTFVAAEYACSDATKPWQDLPQLPWGYHCEDNDPQFWIESGLLPTDGAASVTVSGSLVCSTPGENGWCRGGALTFMANEPWAGQQITVIESSASGQLCVLNAPSGSCSWSPPDGTGPTSFWAVSTYGDTSAMASIPWSFDRIAPALTINAAAAPDGANGWYVNVAPVLSLTASDATSGLSSATFEGGATTLTISAEGMQTLNAMATDRAGNTTQRSLTIRRDSTPPTATLIVSGLTSAPGWFSSASVTTLGADPVSGIAASEVSVNGGPWQTVATLTDGVQTVMGRATNPAGEVTLTPAQVIQLDSQAPVLTLALTGTPGLAGWYTSSVTVTATAADAGSGLARTEHRLDGGVWQIGTSRTVSTNGAHTLDFRATDQAGLTSTTSRTFNLDTLAPSLTLTPNGTLGANGWYVSPVTLQATATDAQSGVAQLEYRLNGGSWIVGSRLSLSGEQASAEVRATDQAGNLSAPITAEQFGIRVDTTAPTLNILLSGTPGLAAWYVSAVTATAQVSDATSGVALTEFRLDGGDWQTGTTLTVATDGPHMVDFRTLDQAGNLSNASQTFNLDTTRPISAFSRPAEGTETKAAGTVAFDGHSSDALAGLATVEISVDGGLTWQLLPVTGGAWSYGWDTLRLPDGLYPILVRASDQAGNRENTARVQILIGNKPPKVEVQASWWLWESGALTVQPRQIDLRDVTLRISCAPYHPDVVLIYPGDQLPTALKWDRLCGNGAYAAESGDYPVTVTACDVFGHCAAAMGVIKVPFIAPPVPTWTPTTEPTATSRPQPTARPTTPPTAQPTLAPAPHPRPVPREPTPEPNWLAASLLIGLAGLVGLASAAIFDPRPQALRRFGKTLEILAGAEKL